MKHKMFPFSVVMTETQKFEERVEHISHLEDAHSVLTCAIANHSDPILKLPSIVEEVIPLVEKLGDLIQRLRPEMPNEFKRLERGY